MFQQHVTRRPVRTAVKVTRHALNHALDVAEPKLESAAVELEDLTRDAYKNLRKASLAKLEDLKDGYGKIEKRVRKQLPPAARSKRTARVLLASAGVLALAFVLFKK